MSHRKVNLLIILCQLDTKINVYKFVHAANLIMSGNLFEFCKSLPWEVRSAYNQLGMCGAVDKGIDS